MLIRSFNVATQQAVDRVPSADEEMELQASSVSIVVGQISDRQFATELRNRGIITQAEAMAFVSRGEIPAALAALIAALPNQEARDDAELLLAGATVFDRANPYVELIGTAFGWSTDQIDDFFRAAAAL